MEFRFSRLNRRSISFLFALFFLCVTQTKTHAQAQSLPPYGAAADAPVTSSSYVDWTSKIFSSSINLDMLKSGITFPSGKSTALNKVRTQIPTLVKDPLLSINIDSQYQLGDLLLDEKITLEELTNLIDSGKRSAGVFDTTGSALRVDHRMSLISLGALFIKHRNSYAPAAPIDYISTRTYTGIIIDARGTLPVQGEYVSAKAEPCLFPRIWDETMNIIYERNMMNPQSALGSGIVLYGYSDNETAYTDRIGKDPLRITARKIYGKNRTDPVISRNDALRILSSPENRALLQSGKIVVLLDRDKIAHAVAAPDKGGDYYIKYEKLKEYAADKRIPDVIPKDTHRGIEISIQNLNFIADTPNLLPSERPRLDTIADMLRTFIADDEFTVLVEGHTARVGQIEGELELSIARAKSIVDALTDRGIPESIFSYRGYGGTMPIAENTTEEGMARNRRVNIIMMPKTTYIQRAGE
jgi:outer membrane protein OmpA-like peptidoglycan-associated protein